MTGKELIEAIVKAANCDLLTPLAVVVAIEFTAKNWKPEATREFGTEVKTRLDQLFEDFTALQNAADQRLRKPSR